MRRMCRGQHRRDSSTYACGSAASTSLSRSPSHQKAGHRAIAHVVPRGGVVNARRPGPRPGRSGAQSIDDAEHGASLKSAMVRRQDLDAGTGRSVRKNMARTRTDCSSIRRPHCSRESGHEVVQAGGASVLHNLRAQTATGGTANDGVNDPVSTAWGHWRGRTAGSFTPSLVQRLRHLLR
jgi:hypothetical protein